jgi:hypothetical protein
MRPFVPARADGTPVTPPPPSEDPDITWVNGRAFRNEALEPTPKYGLTAADQEKLRDRYFEKAELRQAEADLALIQAVRLGAAFRKLDEG